MQTLGVPDEVFPAHRPPQPVPCHGCWCGARRGAGTFPRAVRPPPRPATTSGPVRAPTREAAGPAASPTAAAPAGRESWALGPPREFCLPHRFLRRMACGRVPELGPARHASSQPCRNRLAGPQHLVEREPVESATPWCGRQRGRAIPGRFHRLRPVVDVGWNLLPPGRTLGGRRPAGPCRNSSAVGPGRPLDSGPGPDRVHGGDVVLAPCRRSPGTGVGRPSAVLVPFLTGSWSSRTRDGADGIGREVGDRGQQDLFQPIPVRSRPWYRRHRPRP